MSNSKKWLEFGFIDHIDQITTYIERKDYTEEKRTRFLRVPNFGMINTLQTDSQNGYFVVFWCCLGAGMCQGLLVINFCTNLCSDFRMIRGEENISGV